MPSPFPGMNPYLEHESVFHGLHQRLIVELSNALVPQIRPRYIADTEVNGGAAFDEPKLRAIGDAISAVHE